MTTLLGIQIHEFSIALSDLILFIESGIFAYLIYRRASEGLNFKTIKGLSFFLFFFLSISSFLGFLFHAFFPTKTDTGGGWLVWMLTAISIGLISVIIWYVDALLLNKKSIYRFINYFVGIFLLVYLVTVFFIDYHYPTIIKFYAPPILLLGAVALMRSIATKSRTWIYLFSGILLSLIAAGVQALHFSFDPIYFNYNTLYHIIQGIGLVLLYVSFSRLDGVTRENQ
jgi:hypothetical protein